MVADRRGAAYLGADRRTRAAVAAWRVASVASGLVLVAPIMDVGRRPYRLGRLIDRLSAISGMELIPDALPTQLRWLQYTVVATAVTGIVLPARLRPGHVLVSGPALVLAVLVHRGADDTVTATPTAQLSIAIGVLAVAVVAASVPTVSRRGPPPGASR